MTRKAGLALMACLIVTACDGNESTAPSSSNGFAGRWSGTVVVIPLVAPGAGLPIPQSRPLSFTISAEQRVTAISIGYDFSGRSGVKAFSGLSIAIGASPVPSLRQQGWGYSSASPEGKVRTEVYAAFTSDRTA